MAELSDRLPTTPPTDEWRALVLHQSAYGDPPAAPHFKRIGPAEAAAQNRVNPSEETPKTGALIGYQEFPRTRNIAPAYEPSSIQPATACDASTKAADSPKAQSATTSEEGAKDKATTKDQSITAEEEAGKIIDLAKARLDTIDSLTGYATQEGIEASKKLADEVAKLSPAQAADANTSMIAQYQNMYPTWTPVPTAIVNDYGQSVGMEIRASKLDIWPGPPSLQILDDGKTVTVRRQVAAGEVVDGKQLPPTYVVDAQAARIQR
ncbi:MAG: hypothetical protein U0103_27055 [Candidatus Obscuribacterales bacterium]